MPAFTLAVGAAIVGLLVGAALVPGAPIFALPIVLILVVVLGAGEYRRRSEGEAEAVEFTARDRQTLVD